MEHLQITANGASNIERLLYQLRIKLLNLTGIISDVRVLLLLLLPKINYALIS